MNRAHASCIILIAWLAFPNNLQADDYELYHWVDQDGVAHFSQWAPNEYTPGVKKKNVLDTTPMNYDPDEDRYGISENEKQVKAVWDEIEQRRQYRRERQQNTVAQTVPQRPETVHYYPSAFRYPHTPTHRPHPKPKPVPLPQQTHTLKPLEN